MSEHVLNAIDPPNADEILIKFREKVSDVQDPDKDDDSYLVKWLRARRFDLEKSEEMYRKHVKFFQTNGLDKINENFQPPEATDYVPTSLLGYDKDGSVVRLVHLGACDMKGLVLAITKMDSFRFALFTIKCDVEKQKRDLSKEKICDKQVYIFDLQGLAWRSIIDRNVAQRAMTLLKSYEAHFPETLKVAYVVNAPSFFSFVYNWLKTILPESILSKVEIVSQENCKSVLTKNIEPSILPVAIGGSMLGEDGDELCASMYKFPLNTSVPESLMLYHQLDVLQNDPLAKKVTIEAKNGLIIEKSVVEPNSVLMWDFRTTNYDISFGLHYRKDMSCNSEEIIPPHRVQSHMIPESGSFSCEKPGIYELVFDNQYSWMTKKELTYKVTLLLPHEINSE